MLKRHLRSVLALVLLVALLLPFGVTPANAAYENTYKNTGNMRDDIIGVALTQVGYKEGSNNYTKYGVWYGLPNSPWCGMFVSWCANQAGIPTSVIKRNGIANPSNFGLSYKDGSSYTPKKGDLFFKKNFNHVGLVYYIDGDYFYTVEGNTSTTSSEGTSVMIRRRKISDFYFSSPNYSGSSTTSGCSHSYTTKTESKHPHKEYQECTKCGKSSYTGKTVASNSCTTCIQAACNHDFSKWQKSSNDKHSRTCTKCDLTQTKSHEWEDGKILKEATCVDAGSLQLVCSVCKAESKKDIPATEEHTYGDTSYIDESNHRKICSVCNKQEMSKHSPSNTWKHDALYHWTSCSDCGGRLSSAEHSYSGGCLTPCDTCGFTLNDGHKLTEEFTYNETHHWHLCERCNMEAETQQHIYTSQCDEICNDCGYTRQAPADHSDELHADESGHWYVCTGCNRESTPVDHTADHNANEWEDQVCIQCNFVLVSSERHEHTFHTVSHDEHSHWGTCVCGEVMEAEVHCWNIRSGKCSICDVTYVQNETSKNFFLAFILSLFQIKK